MSTKDKAEKQEKKRQDTASKVPSLDQQSDELAFESLSDSQEVVSSQEEPAVQEEIPPSIEELQRQLAEVQSQAAEYKDGWQRAVADFQNYRRRVEAERNEVYQSTLVETIRRYLPILDDLERALETCPSELAWAEGIELIYRKWKNLLEAEGVRRIEAEGQMFDPRYHEAISQEPVDGYESGRIIGVVQQGYMLGERVIRPALVRVAG